MHARARVFTGISTAAVLMACMTGTASADDWADAARKAVYQQHLAANELAPVTLTEAATYAETQKFVAAAKANGEAAEDINSLLTSGYWIGYPVTTTVADTSEGADPETATELTEAQALLKAPDAAEVAQANNETPSDVVALTSDMTSWTHCLSTAITVTLKNGAGSKIWYYTLAEQYCYNGRTITSRDPEPTINHKVYQWASALGWSWEGPDLTGTKGPAYYSWNGNAKGGLKTWRKGQFKYDPTHVGIGAIQRFPFVHLYEHGDATYKWSWGI